MKLARVYAVWALRGNPIVDAAVAVESELGIDRDGELAAGGLGQAPE
jgi:hypothetical protein